MFKFIICLLGLVGGCENAHDILTNVYPDFVETLNDIDNITKNIPESDCDIYLHAVMFARSYSENDLIEAVVEIGLNDGVETFDYFTINNYYISMRDAYVDVMTDNVDCVFSSSHMNTIKKLTETNQNNASMLFAEKLSNLRPC